MRAYELVVLGVNYEIQKIEYHPMLSHFVYVMNGNNHNVINIHAGDWARINLARAGLLLKVGIFRGGLVDKTQNH